MATEKEIAESNKIIAEFMGTKTINGEWVFPENTIPDLSIYIYDEDLHFLDSWDWLMPVVEKIIKMDFKANDYDAPDYTYLRTFGMIDEESGAVMVRFNRMRLFMSPTLIESTYQAVIEFITWYNTKIQRVKEDGKEDYSKFPSASKYCNGFQG